MLLLAPATGYDVAMQAQGRGPATTLGEALGRLRGQRHGRARRLATIEWTALRRRQPDGHPYDSRFKMLYSTTGLYFLMEGTDRKLTATMTEDFMDLWNEDVFEVFLWTDEQLPGLLRVRDLAAQPRAADPDSQFRRAVPRLAPVALRERPADAQSHDDDRRSRRSRRRRLKDGARSSSSRTRCCGRCRTCRRRRARAGAPTSTAWITTTGRATQWDWARVGRELPRVREVRRPGVCGSLTAELRSANPGCPVVIVPTARPRSGRRRS